MRQYEIMAMAVLHCFIEPCLFPCTGGWVVGEPQNHQAQLPPLLGRQTGKVGSPSRFGAKRQRVDRGIRQFETAAMGGIGGVKDQGALTRIQNGHRQMGSPLLGTHQQQNFGFSINRHTEATLTPSGRCMAKHFGSGMQAVRRTDGILKRTSHGRDHLRRWGQIG